jgi:hypothetical protein
MEHPVNQSDIDRWNQTVTRSLASEQELKALKLEMLTLNPEGLRHEI